MVRFRVNPVIKTKHEPYLKVDPILNPIYKQYYCYMMQQVGGACKNEASMGISCDPCASVHGHNIGILGDKSTKPAAGFWQLEQVIGPFNTVTAACVFVEQWKRKSRTTTSRRRRGLDLVLSQVSQLNASPPLRIYDKRILPRDLSSYCKKYGIDQRNLENHMKRASRAELRTHGGNRASDLIQDIRLSAKDSYDDSIHLPDSSIPC